MAKQKEIKPRVSIKREVPKLPGYIMCVVWLIFTILLIGWVILASFSTSREILSGELFKFASGFHFENYTNAWKSQKISVFFVNSLIYTAISCTMIILVAAPAAYALSRFKFRGNMILQNLFATALGIPVIMIVMPLFSIITSLKLTNTRGLIMFLYIAMNVPFSIFFLLAFFSNLSYTFEEAAAIDGAGPLKTFWQINFRMATPALVVVLVFAFVWTWNETNLTSSYFGNEITTLPVALENFVTRFAKLFPSNNQGTNVSNLETQLSEGIQMAGTLISILPLMLLYVFVERKLVESIDRSGITGE